MRAAILVTLALLAAAPLCAAERRAPAADGAAARMQALVAQVSAERDAARAAQQRAEQALAEAQQESARRDAELAAAQAQNERLRAALSAFEAQNGTLRERLAQEARALRSLDDNHRAQRDQLEKSYAARQELAGERDACLARVATLEGHNIALYRIGMELLERYQDKGLGEVLGAREPLTGTARVRLENLVQDYRFRLEDEAVARGAPPAGSGAPDATPDAAPGASGAPDAP